MKITGSSVLLAFLVIAPALTIDVSAQGMDGNQHHRLMRRPVFDREVNTDATTPSSDSSSASRSTSSSRSSKSSKSSSGSTDSSSASSSASSLPVVPSTAPSFRPSASAFPSTSPSSPPSVSTSPSASPPIIPVTLDNFDVALEEAALDNNLQPVLKQLALMASDLDDCYTGTPDQVRSACSFCCTFPDSCAWNGNATVCERSCVEMQACDNIPENSVIMERSCIGFRACQNVGSDLGITNRSADFVPLFIGPRSCTNAGCQLMGDLALTVAVGSRACLGSRSCQELGPVTNGSIFVGSGSCDDFSSCDDFASSANAADIIIGPHSCTGEDACSGLADRAATLASVRIGRNSCGGPSSCQEMGSFATSDIVIGDESCLEFNACEGIGSAMATSISIGNGSCDGEEDACFEVGRSAANVTIGNNACIGFEVSGICNEFGQDVSGAAVAIGDGLCTPFSAEPCCVGSRPDCTSDCGGFSCATSFAITMEGDRCDSICQLP